LLVLLKRAGVLGHATQWGEVKTKKSKKEAQKQRVVAATSPTLSPHQTSSSTYYTTPRESRPTQPHRSYNNDRVNRPGKGK
jgi:hypothetical protein